MKSLQGLRGWQSWWVAFASGHFEFFTIQGFCGKIKLKFALVLPITIQLSFSSFSFDSRVMEGIDAMNFATPTPIQQLVIPEILSGRDAIACAQTGTGKTAAFLLPIINRILTSHPGDYVKCLVIVPTRELAIQISQQLEGFAYFTGISSIAVFGGGDGTVYSSEKKAFTSGVDVVVCTPGRMISHLNLGYVKFDNLKFLVLDEADRMLDMGFHDDIVKIKSYITSQYQGLLFSATMPHNIRVLARKILKNPVEINISTSVPAEKIKQEAFIVYESQKTKLVKHLISDAQNLKSVLVFCGTKLKVKELSRELRKNNKDVEEIHSDLEQVTREEVMNRFKAKQTRVLIATDIVSRGIDVEDIDLVINYNVPGDAEDYVHRIGRTARAQSEGRACTLVSEKEQRGFASIEKFIGIEVPKISLPRGLGDGPLYEPARQQRGDGRDGRRHFNRSVSKVDLTHKKKFKPRPKQ